MVNRLMNRRKFVRESGIGCRNYKLRYRGCLCRKLDLYRAHRCDYETPLEETLRAFDDLVRQGKVST
jgi:hypothetical protein